MAFFRMRLGQPRLTRNQRRIVQQVNVKHTDVLRISFHIKYQHRYVYHSYVYRQSRNFHGFTFPDIPFNIFYNQVEGQDYLKTNLSLCGIFFTAELLQELVPDIISLSQNFCKLDQDCPEDGIQVAKASDSEPVVYHMDLLCEFTVVHYREEQEMINETIQESMEEIMMIPAATEAIQELLKKPKIVKEDESCVICMQEFGDDEEEEQKALSAMPCDHVFHTKCILHWLEMNHKCPLCRYALPTVNNQETN